jgi:eukaryotic-like serine/threonine-protein kinase
MREEWLSSLLLAWREYRCQGRDVSAPELCHDCPELAEELGQRIAVLRQMNEFALPGNGPSGLDPTADTAAPTTVSVQVGKGADGTGETLGEGIASPSNGTSVPGSVPGYELLAELGHGGMGVVYQARQAGLNRLVALKMVKAGADVGPEEVARFCREAEVTGGLEHPGIVPVHNLGNSVDGRPFYAMRLIRGDSLMAAIDRFHKAERSGRDPRERNLGLRDLLGRFVAACNAVAYAHSRGVLHRDLKPQNVMLGRFGETLVVDWGLAKPLGQGEADTPEGPLVPAEQESQTPTQMGAVVGTPSYMSPEQSVGATDRIGPASDVYGLGAVLYCLLVGRPPFAGRDLWALLQKVQKGEFERPRREKPNVPAALEAVCVKAMATRPSDRYATGREVAEEVERWLADEPVSVYAEPWPVRAGRWMRKHRALVGSTAAGLVLAMVFLTTLALVTARQNHILAEANARERAAAELAQKTIEDMTSADALKFLETQQELRPEQKKFLEQALAYYRASTERTPTDEHEEARQGRAFFRMGGLQYGLGLLAPAEPSYRAALKEQERLAAEHPQVSQYREDLAKSHSSLGNLLAHLGKSDEAEREYRAALREQERLAAEHPQVPEYRQGLAVSLMNQGTLLAGLAKRDDAEREYRAALKEQERLAAEHPQVPEYRQDLAKCHGSLGNLLSNLGKSDDAEREYRAALREQERLAAEHPGAPAYRLDLAKNHTNLGRLLSRLRKRDEAEQEYRAALSALEHLAAEYPQKQEYRLDLAKSHNNLGLLLVDLRQQFDDGEREYRAALKEWERLAVENPQVPAYRKGLAVSLYDLGLLLRHLGKRDAAEREVRSAVTQMERVVTENPQVPDFHNLLAATLWLLADLRSRAGDAAEARIILQKARPHHAAALGANPRDLSYQRFYRDNLSALSDACHAVGDHAASVAAAQQLAGCAFDPVLNTHKGACYVARAILLAEKDNMLSEARRHELAKTYADQAMDLLRQAVAKGYKDAARMKQDADLDPIRNREDFKRLIGELEAKK